ncbi:MAG: Yip1 family protein [Pseudomonadota bacterium]|nr:Yip1 family protein [Pseudomonadota bacterium]
MTQDLIGRVQGLLMSPKAEWDKIDGETVDTQKLILGYVAPLAAIPAIAGLIGPIIFGYPGLAEAYKPTMGMLFPAAIYNFIMAIVMVFLISFVINALAPTFGAQSNQQQALKVAAYWPTAAWVSGVFMLIPMLGILTVVGLVYSLYLLFVGLPKLMKPPADKATVYTIVSLVVAVVVAIVINSLSLLVMPKPGL